MWKTAENFLNDKFGAYKSESKGIFFDFPSPCKVEIIMFTDQIFEIEILMDLHVLEPLYAKCTCLALDQFMCMNVCGMFFVNITLK